MIARLVKGSGFRGCLNYLLDKNKSAEIIGGNMMGENARELAAEFGVMREMRPSLGKAVCHVSLSVAADDVRLDEFNWADIADRYMRDMGFAQSQYALIRHDDTDHQHVHIVANRVDIHGKTVSAQNDFRRSAKSLHDIEREFGLQPVNQPPGKKSKGGAKGPSRGELQMMIRTEKLSKKAALQTLVDAAAQGQPTMSAFVDRLHRSGVGVQCHIQSTGRISGISFDHGDAVLKGSSLGKSYSFNGLQKHLGVTYEKDRDFGTLEKGTVGAKKKELARVNQIERGYIDRGRRLEKSEKDRDEAAAAVREKDTEIDGLQAQNSRLFTAVEGLGRKLEKRDESIEERDQKLAEQGTEIDALQTANAQSQKLLKAAGKTNQQQKAAIELLRKDQRAYREAYDKKDEENAVLKGALENYKQAYDQQARDRGHEKG